MLEGNVKGANGDMEGMKFGVIYFYRNPKNRNKCWNIVGFPFPLGLKNIVLKFISNKVICHDDTLFILILFYSEIIYQQ
mgnify:CR=1 FL=1